MATSGTAYRQIIKELSKDSYKPVYFLQGDEPFFIDSISDYIREHAIPPEARDFNQIVLYGNETGMNEVIQRAKAYPMGADRQVIIVKEAQYLFKKDSDNGGASDILISYLQQPQLSTILVFCHKNGSLDHRKKIIAVVEKAGVLFDSKKVKEDELPDFMEEILKEHDHKMSAKSMSMMTEFVGADLCRLSNEMEKLLTAIPDDIKEITPEFIEQHVGVSKDYNIFEFRDAIVNKNVLKANKIVAYYENNPQYPIQKLISVVIYPFFSNLMLAFYAPDKTDRGIADQLDLKSTWAVRDYINGMHNYTASQTMKIITTIRKYDGKSKGIDATSNTQEGLLKELIYIILH